MFTVIDVDTEQLDKPMPEVTEQEDVILRVTPLLEGLLGWSVVGANPDDLCTQSIEFSHALRVTAYLSFARVREALWKKEQDYRVPAVVADAVHLVIGSHQGQVWRCISDRDH